MKKFKLSGNNKLRKSSQLHKYRNFLKSHYWRQVRKAVLTRDSYCCQQCGSARGLQVHHITYRNHLDELNHLEDLVTLCKRCHNREHQK